MKYLIAYDIADDRRLRLVAQYWERVAQRVQRSVFLFDGTSTELENLMRGVLSVVDIHEDVVQAWPVASPSTAGWLELGTVSPGPCLCLIVTPERLHYLRDEPCLVG